MKSSGRSVIASIAPATVAIGKSEADLIATRLRFKGKAMRDLGLAFDIVEACGGKITVSLSLDWFTHVPTGR